MLLHGGRHPIHEDLIVLRLSQDTEVAYALVFAVGVLMIPEIAPPGLEGVTYGAITTFHNSAMNISSLINNLILAFWKSNTETCAPHALHTLPLRFHVNRFHVNPLLLAPTREHR